MRYLKQNVNTLGHCCNLQFYLFINTYVIKLDDIIGPLRLLRDNFVFVTVTERVPVTNKSVLNVLSHKVCIRVSVAVSY